MRQVDNLIGTKKTAWDRQLTDALGQLRDTEGRLYRYRTESEVKAHENKELVRRLDLVARASHQLSEKYEARIQKQDDELNRLRMASSARIAMKSPAVVPQYSIEELIGAAYGTSQPTSPPIQPLYQQIQPVPAWAAGPPAAQTLGHEDAMQMELNTAHAMVANRDETIAQLKQAAQDALIVNDSAVAESCALMELLRKGDWTAAGSSDTPMDDDTKLEHQRDMAFLKQSLAELNTLDAESVSRERVEAQALQGQVGSLTELASTQARRIAELEDQCQSHDQQRERHTKHEAELSSLKQAVIDLESANDQDAAKAVTMQTGLRERIAELHGALEQQEARRVSQEAQATIDRNKLADEQRNSRTAYEQQIKTLGHELQSVTRRLQDQIPEDAAAVAVADEYLRRLQQRDGDLLTSRQSEMLAIAELDRVSSECDRVIGELNEANIELDRRSGELDRVTSEVDNTNAELDRVSCELDRVTSEATSELLLAQEDSAATLRSFAEAHAKALRARDAQLRSLQEHIAASVRHGVIATADDAQPMPEEHIEGRHQLEALTTLVDQHAQELEKRDSDIQTAAETFRQLENGHAQAAAEATSVRATLERQVQELMARIAHLESQPELRQDNAFSKKNQQLGEQNERLRGELTALLGETHHLRQKLADAPQQPANPDNGLETNPDKIPGEKGVAFDGVTTGSGPTTASAATVVEGVEVSSALQTALWEKEEFRALAQLESSRLKQLKNECKNWLSEVSLLQNAFTEASAKLAAMEQTYGVVTAERDQLRTHLVNIQQQMGAGKMEVLSASAVASEALDISAATSIGGATLRGDGSISDATGILDASAATSIGMALDDLRPRTAPCERPRTAEAEDPSPGVTISVTSPLASAARVVDAILYPGASSASPGPAEQPASRPSAPDLQQPTPVRLSGDGAHAGVRKAPVDTAVQHLTPGRQPEQPEQPVDLSAISTMSSALSYSPVSTPQQASSIFGTPYHTSAMQGSTRIKSVLDSYVADAVLPPPLPTQLFDSISRFLEEEEQRESVLLSAVELLAEPLPEMPLANP